MGIGIPPDGKVLIVGGMSRNFPEADRFPRIILWPSFQEKRQRRIPSDVKVVLCTRFVSHNQHLGLKKSVGDGVFVHQELLGTGKIKRILKDLGVLDKREELKEEVEDLISQTPIHINIPKPKSAVEIEGHQSNEVPADIVLQTQEVSVTVTRTKKGVLKDFVLKYCDPNHQNTRKEGERLLRLARAEGINTSLHSVEQTIRNIRKSSKKEGLPQANEGVLEPVCHTETHETIHESIVALERLIEHASELRNIAELASVATLEIKEENLRLKGELDLLRKENQTLKEAIQNQESRLARLKELLD